MKERTAAHFVAPYSEWKPPEIFCLTFITRPSGGRAELSLEVILARDRHAANSVGLEMLPRRLIGVAIRRMGR